MMEKWDLIIIGGGAAGYFGAIACAEACPGARVLILEATARVLTKVKISGGGRCNVTHHQFDPKRLVLCYPRGKKELISAFHAFQPKDTIQWFSDHGVTLKAEADGRMFPNTDNSQTIIDCFESAADKSGVVLRKNTCVQKMIPCTDGYELCIRGSDTKLKTRYVLMATGSMSYGMSLVEQLGIRLVPPVPSLFTFQINAPLLKDLQGVSFSSVHIKLKIGNPVQEFIQEGPCLITHWGLSGPAVLKLSAFAARELHQSDYQADLQINWVFPLKTEDILQRLNALKQHSPKRKIIQENIFNCVRRFWEAVLRESGLTENALLGEISKAQLNTIANYLTQTNFRLTGKGIFKEEFVTAGGVARDEIDFRTMESKKLSGVYFAGEVIDIDGITGGFNFQNAWTGGWIAGHAIAKKVIETMNQPVEIV